VTCITDPTVANESSEREYQKAAKHDLARVSKPKNGSLAKRTLATTTARRPAHERVLAKVKIRGLDLDVIGPRSLSSDRSERSRLGSVAMRIGT
jgi:hypothetical protein